MDRLMRTPWTGNEVVYHIYPLSFADSDGDGYGDLKGIIGHLDHLGGTGRDALRVDAIWLSPIYPSPLVDFGYDVSDHRNIDPLFGSLKDFDRLIAETRRRSIKIVLDLVLNHTSDRHPWFMSSRASRNDPKRDWYIWRDPAPDGGPPNNWQSVFGGSAWSFDERSGQYFMHSFLPEQPDLNWRNPRVERAMTGVMRFWLKRGVRGFRLDAVYHLMKDPAFRNEPRNPEYRAGRDEPYKEFRHIHCQRRPETFDVLRRLGGVARRHGAFLIGEAYLDVKGMREFYLRCDRLRYAPMNFNLLTLPWDASTYRRFIDSFEDSLPKGAVPTYVFGNHDRPRLATRLSGARPRVAATLLLTLRGMPFIYYGEEIGMRDVPVPHRSERDPFGKRVPGFRLGRDPQRTPMQWTNGPKAGFTKGTPWLPISDDKRFDVRSEAADPRSLLTLYRSLISLRRDNIALKEGTYRSLRTPNGAFAFSRTKKPWRTVVVANFTGRRLDVALPMARRGRILCDSALECAPGTEVDLRRFGLGPDRAMVIDASRR